MYYDLLLLNLRSGVYFFYFFTFFLLWLKREKNSGWYIHLTSHQLPPNLHNVTSAWPVMLLANQRLRHGNQILAGIMSLSKSILGKRKFLSTFLKKNLNVFFFFCDEILLAGAAVTFIDFVLCRKQRKKN